MMKISLIKSLIVNTFYVMRILCIIATTIILICLILVKDKSSKRQMLIFGAKIATGYMLMYLAAKLVS